jgi:hypothetical protein
MPTPHGLTRLTKPFTHKGVVHELGGPVVGILTNKDFAAAFVGPGDAKRTPSWIASELLGTVDLFLYVCVGFPESRLPSRVPILVLRRDGYYLCRLWSP